jgi:DNA adenine methylase
MSFEPAVKWSGSKRSQAFEILSYFKKDIDVYYEPFCGGCSVLRRLLDDKEIHVNKYVISDINSDLINLWNEIKDNPTFMSTKYKEMWSELNQDDDKDRKRSYFEDVRSRYNKTHKAEDFLFIMRTTTNGMPRYNKSGEFNNSFHITRNGINPETLSQILDEWSNVLNLNNVEFKCCNYLDIKSNSEDLLYLDPPYANTKGMYTGALKYDEFFEWLSKQDGYYLLSFDGKSGDVDNTYNVPENVYSKHLYIKSGNSSFKRIIGKSRDSMVYESLYLK